MAQTTSSDPIPTYTIDLSQPPETRYDEIIRDFGARMRSLQGLFDEILTLVLPTSWIPKLTKVAAKMTVRHVYDDEEMRELRAISKGTQVPLYLLVVLNNLLDCLMGCTSGAALTKPAGRRRKGEDPALRQPRLMHLRTLDWTMQGLKDLLLIVTYVDTAKTGDRVLARSATYAGFVGTLTAVRQDLSISLNFRPNHDCSTRTLRQHQLLVLLGYRRSIGSILRHIILEPFNHSSPDNPNDYSLKAQATELSLQQTAPCYLTLCDGKEVAIIEKDLEKGRVRTARDFMIHTNHDVDHIDETSPTDYPAISALGAEDWLEESTERKEKFERKWTKHLEKARARVARDGGFLSRTLSPIHEGDEVPVPPVAESTLKKWIESDTLMAECTHFACLMDPRTGEIRWIRRGPTPEVDLDDP